MSETLDIPVGDIRAKIVSIRAQLGREITKMKRKKSGQGASESYKSNWVYWERLQFLVPVMNAGKSRDNLTPERSPSPGSVESHSETNGFIEAECQEIYESQRPKSRKRKAEIEDITWRRGDTNFIFLC